VTDGELFKMKVWCCQGLVLKNAQHMG